VPKSSPTLRPLTEPVPGAATFDLLIVTAANRAQARGYESELSSRERNGRLEGCGEWRVIPDPGDRRAGSGGSTLCILQQLLRERRLSRGHTLILHSGGDSRRLPAYAAHGKIFLPLPMEDDRGREIAMFDLILADLRGMHLGDKPRVVIGAGDVYLGLARHFPDMTGADVVGLAFPDTPARGRRHGVYVAAADGRVKDFLQKPSPRLARQRGAIDKAGRVLVDSGVVSLSQRASLALARAAAHAPPVAVDLYDQVLSALRPNTTATAYAAAIPTHRPWFQRLHRAVHNLSFDVRTMPTCDFMHIGTTRELLDLFPRLRTAPTDHASSHIESCPTPGPLRLLGRNVVVGLPRQVSRLSLPKGIGLVALPIGPIDWAFILFGDEDDGKSPRPRGTFLNRPLSRLPAERWPGLAPDQHTSWTARLWTVGPPARALASSLRWLRSTRRPRPAHPPQGVRFSIAQLLPRINHQRLLVHREECRRSIAPATLAARATRSPWLSSKDATADLASPAQAATAIHDLERAIRAANPLAQARLARLQHAIAHKFPTAARPIRAPLAALWQRPFAAIASAVALDAQLPSRPPRRGSGGILSDQVVWVTCPARIDLSGGWTDTPPICNEVGGAVVNAAITLNGQYPVQAICRLTNRPAIRITSVDLGNSISFESARAIHRCDNPAHWSALPQAALIVSGIAPPYPSDSLSRWLKDFGGIDLTVFSALPKGSGLGTSSILGAAVLASLLRASGQRISTADLIRRTSLLEQFMRTGGGWQDQCGGIAPGVKLLTSNPGLEQHIQIKAIPGGGCLANPESQSRVLLYYTGQRRLAKNILQNVVGRYLDREPAMRRILSSLHASAADMCWALSGGTLRDAARCLSRYWELKKAIDPGASNDLIEGIIARVHRHVDGLGIAGAGGGGFLVMIARDHQAAARIRRALTKYPAAPTARFYDWAIDTKGLHTSVL
jgi:galactokinase/mevalonate kinase-like predicted kinase